MLLLDYFGLKQPKTNCLLFLSSMLNQRKQAMNNVKPEIHSSMTSEEYYDDSIVLAMYQILLKWSMSIDTFHALKKASLSCLPVLVKFALDVTTVYNVVHISITWSLFEMPSWKNSVPAVFEMLSYQPTLELVVNGVNDYYIYKALNLLLVKGEKVKCIVKDYYHTQKGTEYGGEPTRQ